MKLKWKNGDERVEGRLIEESDISWLLKPVVFFGDGFTRKDPNGIRFRKALWEEER